MKSATAIAPAALSMALAAMLSACAVGPNYAKPSTPLSPTFKEAAGWAPAAPAELSAKGDWWTLFNDPILNGLEQRVKVSNQNVAAAEAAYREARATVSEQQASLFPSIDLTGNATRTGGSSRTQTSTSGGVVTGGGSGARNSYRASLGASWEPDVWGRIRRTVEAAKATAQADEADLANATLSAQSELAVDYFGLRQADIDRALSQATVEAYQRTLTTTQNRFNAGVAPHSDVLQAQTQLANAQADLAGTEQTRATYEHAIAVLVGEAPGNFSIAPVQNWTAATPEVPAGVPSTLLQRRPDVAAAERQMAAANAQIGVATAAYFPSLTLTGSYGYAGAELGSLIGASNSVWSYGAAVAETVLDFGARRARVKETRAAYDAAVARYRQTALTALQEVEDQLAAGRVLREQYVLRQQAAAAADQAEQMVANQYQQGTVSYIELSTAQASAYNARRTLAQAAAQRQTAATSLITALGGGWTQPSN